MASTRETTVDVPGIGPVTVRQSEMESALGPTGRWKFVSASRVLPGDRLTPEQLAQVKEHVGG